MRIYIYIYIYIFLISNGIVLNKSPGTPHSENMFQNDMLNNISLSKPFYSLLGKTLNRKNYYVEKFFFFL